MQWNNVMCHPVEKRLTSGKNSSTTTIAERLSSFTTAPLPASKSDKQKQCAAPAPPLDRSESGENIGGRGRGLHRVKGNTDRGVERWIWVERSIIFFKGIWAKSLFSGTSVIDELLKSVNHEKALENDPIFQ